MDGGITRSLKGVAIPIGVLLTLFIGFFYLKGDDEAFRVAERSIRSSAAVENLVGSVSQISFGGIRMHYANFSPSMDVDATVTGQRGKTIAHLNLEKIDRRWKVKEITFKGKVDRL